MLVFAYVIHLDSEVPVSSAHLVSPHLSTVICGRESKYILRSEAAKMFGTGSGYLGYGIIENTGIAAATAGVGFLAKTGRAPTTFPLSLPFMAFTAPIGAGILPTASSRVTLASAQGAAQAVRFAAAGAVTGLGVDFIARGAPITLGAVGLTAANDYRVAMLSGAAGGVGGMALGHFVG